MKRRTSILSLALLPLFLSACGSSGDSQPTPAPTPTPTPTASKLVALTFDDGPDILNVDNPQLNRTELVLAKLKSHGVVATFFMVGEKVSDPASQTVVDHVVAMGNEIGNHSWNYDGLNSKSAAEVQDFVDRTTVAIKDRSGLDVKFFRPPNLSTSPAMISTIGFPFVSGVLAFDWDGQGTSAQKRADNVLNDANMKDGAIILMHDVQPLPHPTPEALDIIIPALKSKGYEFVTLSELFKRKNVVPAAHDGKMWVVVE